MKRLITLLLVLTLSLGALALPAAAEEKSIEVWMISNPSESILKAFDDAAADFAAATGIKVNYVRIATNDFHTKLVTNISAKMYPDMVIWNTTPGIEFFKTGIVAPVDDLADEVGRDKYAESVLKMFTIDGALYEIPLLMRPAGLHVRKSWMEKAGYDTVLKTDENGKYYYEGLRTWDDVLGLGKKLTDAANGKYGLGFQYSRLGFGDSAGNMLGILFSFGASLIDENNQSAINSPEAIAAFDYVKRVWDSGAVPSAATTWDGNANNQYFIQGDIGIVNNSNSILGKLGADTAFGPDDVIILPNPEGPAGLALCSGSPDTITLFKTAKLDDAREYAKYLLKLDTQVKMFETMGFGYYSPVRTDVQAAPLFANLSDNEKVFMQNTLGASSPSYPGQPDARVAALYSSFILDDAMSHIAVDGWTPQQVVEDMEAKVKEALED
jgi:ABC-type glycerol-3-phosphate transport system substrate-binding protein